MIRAMVCVLSAAVALGQQEPIDGAIGDYWRDRTLGRFDESALKRTEARAALERARTDMPQFANWALNVSSLYASAEWTAEARAVLQDALSRMTESHPGRAMLLGALADSWEQDGNLLKSLVYREKQAVAEEKAPQTATDQRAYVMRFPRNTGAYERLAQLYQQLGRKQDAEAVRAKLRKVAPDNVHALASQYEQEGKIDEAAAVYKKTADASSLQALANLYERHQRSADAIATLQQAIAAAQAQGRPESLRNTIGMRENLARILQHSGLVDEAGQVHEQLISDTATSSKDARLPAVLGYADFLISTKRGAQAEQILKDLLSQPNLEAWESINILHSLSNAARAGGDDKRAAEYSKAANDRQAAMRNEPGGHFFIHDDLMKATAAANAGHVDEAFGLALQALSAASGASDRDQLVGGISGLANVFVAKHAPEQADQLNQRVLALTQSWSKDTIQPAIYALENYVHFLMQQKERWADVPAAIEQYGNSIKAARGTGTHRLAAVLELQMNSQMMNGERATAVRVAEELVALEETLIGPTGQPLLSALTQLANALELNGGLSRALPLFRRMVAISDAVYPPTEPQRAWVRMQAATAFARDRQFDEADRLASEAVAIVPDKKQLGPQLEAIARMKAR